MVTIPEGKIVDFIDGKLRQKSAEEYVRQNTERSLVQEYRYAREEIAVEFKVKLGSSSKRADLAVFPEEHAHSQSNVLLLIECKKEGTSSKDRKEGIEQLKSYMAACPNCRFGLWTNGSDERLCLRREERNRRVDFVEVVDIPQKGSDEAEVDLPERHQLRPATGDNLLLAFRRCHNYIAGNQGLQKTEAFWELLKIIFSKIEDERSLGQLTFYVTSREQRDADGQLKCKKRIGKLFAKVKRNHRAIFKQNEVIELNRTVLAYIVAQLQNYSLLDSSVDVKGVAYEEIVGSNLRGDRGEFFTPRNACKMAVEMLDPVPGARIIDPAMGTGGFLVTAMNRVLEKFTAAKKETWRDPNSPSESELAELYRSRQDLIQTTVSGLDLNPNLVRAAKMNMVMNNDGSGGLTQADSLRNPSIWSAEAQAIAPLASFDYLFTNPPFGTKIRIDAPEVLEQYELAAIWDLDEESQAWTKRLLPSGQPELQTSQPPEILFIERSLQLLKPGTGCMAIVVPNGILNNPPLGYVRQWIIDNAQVLAVVDMQRDLFQPKNDTQTSMVLLRRLDESEKGRRADYPIFFAVTDKIGHDKRGHPIVRRDVEGNDILAAHQVRISTIKDGKLVEELINEERPVIDDQLPEIPATFISWQREHGLA